MARRSTFSARQHTFAHWVGASKQTADRALWRRAGLANSLAKVSTGAAREALYQIKNRALRQLMTRGRVVVRVDSDRCIGLLSIQAIGTHRVRLHTHENWLGVGWRSRA